MKIKKYISRSILITLALVMLLQIPAMAAPAQGSFPDVPSSEWFAENVTLLAKHGIISGYPDGTFKPNNLLTRGEFIKMLTTVAEIWTDKAPSGIHWAEDSWNALNDTGITEISTGYNSNGVIFPCTRKALDAPITRYEMAFLLNGVLYMAFYENPMALSNAKDSYANHISDYNSMDKGYQGAVEQVFSKGILSGYSDGSFQGGNNLTRAEAATAIVHLAWSNTRKKVDFAAETERPAVDPGFVSFAMQYRTMSNSQRRQALFGNPNKTHFTSAADAKGHMTTVEVPIWRLNTKTGVKTASKTWVEVNNVLAKEVKAIFTEIYNSPERFPMNGVGGARYSDTMRHSWGAAIDINANENYYINYKTGQTVGKFCYKNGSSPYCITPNSSVVKAFAKYGWGWGGQGWSTAADYMHFSILASGG
ncbi:MAG: S-layer homology domain-containing protein [Oscillospiraceae bacterium]